MNARRAPFARAVLLSLLLHAVLAAVWGRLPPAARRAVPPLPPLAAVIVPRAAPTAPPPLFLPDAARSAEAGAPPPRRHASRAAGAAPAPTAAMRQAAEQIGRRLLYPPEAVERGIEGEAIVLLFLDESGNAVAARLEHSSGHAVLDEAALRAAREVRSLAGTAPREFLLPVRFRLR